MRRVGMVDIGSNTVRLSIVEIRTDGGYLVRHEQKANLRLAARINADGTFQPSAADEAITILQDFQAAGDDWNVGRWSAVATAAVRQAVDGPAFVDRIARAVGINIRIINAAEEAHAGLIGALNTIAEQDGFTVDIGGGSTEITRFVARRRVTGVSLQWGAVNAAARFGLEGRAKAGALAELTKALDGALQEQDPRIFSAPGLRLIGIGGTARALAKLDRRRRHYPLPAVHNYLLPPSQVIAFRDELTAMNVNERARVPGLTADRADLLAAGTALFAWVVERARPVHVVVSGSGLREGLFYQEFLADHETPVFDDVLEASISNLERLHGLPVGRCRRIAGLATSIWTALGDEARTIRPPLVAAAARLRDVGTTVNYYDRERHAAYILREGRLFGVDHRERLLLAAAAGYEGPSKTRSWLAPFAALLTSGDEQLAICMGICVSLAHRIDADTRGHAGPLSLTVLPSAVRITTSGNSPHGFASAQALGGDFRKAFGRALALGTAASTD